MEMVPKYRFCSSVTSRVSTLPRAMRSAHSSTPRSFRTLNTLVRMKLSTLEGAVSGVCLPIKVRTRSLAGCSSISSGEAIWTISPAAMKMMMSASFSASLMSWLTKTMVLFSFCCRFFTSSCRDSRVKGSRAE